MNKLFVAALLAVALPSCVSLSEHGALQEEYNKLQAQNTDLTHTKVSLSSENAGLKAQLSVLQDEHTLTLEKIAALQASYDSLASNSSQRILKQIEDNEKLLANLSEKEARLNEEIVRVDNLKALIAAKEAQMEQLKASISKALHDFEGKGLTVVQKNGNIYVSMENKLLFKSGSWAVGSEGETAVVQLANVLSANKDINVLIEGHTDNIPYGSPTGQLLDNWDLSVKRATAIVRILEEHKVNPVKITAAGRSEHIPIAENETKEGKAKNRRIEIILTPNLDEVTKLLAQ